MTISKTVATIQDSANSREKLSECLPSPFTYSVNLFQKLWTDLLIEPVEISFHIFSSAPFNSETVLGFRGRFRNSFVYRSLDAIFPCHSNMASKVAVVPFQSLVDSTVLV